MLRGRAPVEGVEEAGESPAGELLPGSRTPTVWPGTCRGGRESRDGGKHAYMLCEAEGAYTECDAGNWRAACRKRALERRNGKDKEIGECVGRAPADALQRPTAGHLIQATPLFVRYVAPTLPAPAPTAPQPLVPCTTRSSAMRRVLP